MCQPLEHDDSSLFYAQQNEIHGRLDSTLRQSKFKFRSSLPAPPWKSFQCTDPSALTKPEEILLEKWAKSEAILSRRLYVREK